MQKVILCTDEAHFTYIIPSLFKGAAEIQVIARDQLDHTLYSKPECSYFILGIHSVDALTQVERESIQLNRTTPIYLLFQRDASPEELISARELGIQGILLDPLVKIMKLSGNLVNVFQFLDPTGSEQIQ